MPAIPPIEELEQMSTEDLEALAAQVAQEPGMAPPMGDMPPADMPADMPLEEEMVQAGVEEAAEGEAPTESAEIVLGQILSETQNPGDVVEQLRSAGFEITPVPGAVGAVAEEDAMMAEEVAEEEIEGPSAAAVSEPVNMRDLRKKAASNALNKGA